MLASPEEQLCEHIPNLDCGTAREVSLPWRWSSKHGRVRNAADQAMVWLFARKFQEGTTAEEKAADDAKRNDCNRRKKAEEARRAEEDNRDVQVARVGATTPKNSARSR
jgi:hypothetical protein